MACTFIKIRYFIGCVYDLVSDNFEVKNMKNLFVLLLLFFLCGCYTAGEFTKDTHELYEMGRPDCEKTPERCYKGIPW